MPRQNQKAIRGQKSVDPQNTFDFTVPRGDTVHARTYDTYVRPSETPDAKNILNFVDGIEKATKAGVAGWIETKKEKQAKGALAHDTGEAAPAKPGLISWPGSEDFYIGYERARGKAAAFDYNNELLQKRTEKGEWSLEEWDTVKNELSQKYMDGQSDYYLSGFAPTAVQQERYQDREMTQTITDQVKANLTDTTLRNFRGEVQAMMNVEGDLDHSKIQGLYQSTREELVKIGYTPKEAAKTALSTISLMAVEQGRPELFNFSVLKDANNVSPAQNPELAQVIYNGRKMAEDEVIRKENRAEKAKKQAHDNAIEAYEVTLVKGLETDDTTEAKKSLLGLIDSKTITLNEYKAYKQALIDWQDETGWAETDDFETETRLESLAYKGKLSMDRVLAEKPNLTRKRATSLMTLQHSIKDRKRTEKGTQNPYHPEEKVAKAIKGNYTAGMTISGKLIPDIKGGPEMAEKWEALYYPMLDAYWQENGKRPSYKEALELGEKAKEMVESNWEYDLITRRLVPKGTATVIVEEKSKGKSGGSLRGAADRSRKQSK